MARAGITASFNFESGTSLPSIDGCTRGLPSTITKDAFIGSLTNLFQREPTCCVKFSFTQIGANFPDSPDFPGDVRNANESAISAGVTTIGCAETFMVNGSLTACRANSNRAVASLADAFGLTFFIGNSITFFFSQYFLTALIAFFRSISVPESELTTRGSNSLNVIVASRALFVVLISKGRSAFMNFSLSIFKVGVRSVLEVKRENKLIGFIVRSGAFSIVASKSTEIPAFLGEIEILAVFAVKFILLLTFLLS